jgi:hypothetical protein
VVGSLTKRLSLLFESYNKPWKRKANDFSTPCLIVSHFQHPLLAVLGSGLALTNSSTCFITPLFQFSERASVQWPSKTKRSDAFPNPPFLPKHITNDNDLNDQQQHHPQSSSSRHEAKRAQDFFFYDDGFWDEFMRCKTNVCGHPVGLHRRTDWAGLGHGRDNTGFPFDFYFCFFDQHLPYGNELPLA